MANIIKITLPDGSTYDVGNSLCLGISNQTWNTEETQFTGTLDYTRAEILDLVANGTFVWFQYYDWYDDIIITLFPCGEYWMDQEYYRVGHLTENGITVDKKCGFAPLDNPVFTGVAIAPTPSVSDNSTRIATTAWVNDKIDVILPSVTSLDNGKFLRVVNGAWAAASVSNANGVSF